MNERYLPQLAAVLTFPQSVGIVGGRPGASLYFLGVQGSAVLYLDPHEVQEVRCGRGACRVTNADTRRAARGTQQMPPRGIAACCFSVPAENALQQASGIKKEISFQL